MNPVIEALRFRHACKRFNPEKKIGPEDMDTILTAAHLSPSSFGMEAWKFLVLESMEIRQALRPACWDQAQITESSHVVVILAQPELVAPASEFVKESFARRGLSEEMTQAYIDRFKWFIETAVSPRMSMYSWCAKQCYIALANIMTTAASLGIDSCPVEGFEKEKAEPILGIDGSAGEIAVMVALGYRAGEQTPQIRRDKNILIEYR